MKTNFHNTDVLKAFTATLAGIGITPEQMKGKDIVLSLPVPELADFNQIIAAPLGYDNYKTEKGALKAWVGIVNGYLDGYQGDIKQTAKHKAHADAVEAENTGLSAEQKAANKELVKVEKTISTITKSMLATFKKANVDYAFYDLVQPVRDYIHLGRMAGRNSVETMAEIRKHVYDLAGYLARGSKKTTEEESDIDAQISDDLSISRVFESNVTRAVKCGLLSERGILDITKQDHEGKAKLHAPYNQLCPSIKVGGKEVTNAYAHLVPISISAMEKRYAEVFTGTKRDTRTAKAGTVAEAAQLLGANADGFKDMKADLQGDVTTALQAALSNPEITKAVMTGSDSVAIIKGMTDAIKDMTLDDDSLAALVALAEVVDSRIEKYEGATPNEMAATI